MSNETYCTPSDSQTAPETVDPIKGVRSTNRILYFQNLCRDLLVQAHVATKEGRPLDAWCLRLEAEDLY